MTVTQFPAMNPRDAGLANDLAAFTQPLAIDELQRLSGRLGLPLWCYDPRSGTVLASTDNNLLPVVPSELLWKSLHTRTGCVREGTSGLISFAIPLSAENETPWIAAGYVLAQTGIRPTDLVLAAADRNWSAAQLNDGLARIPVCHPELLKRLIALASADLARWHEHAATQTDTVRIAEQLEHTYEEISLLHSLAQNMQLSRAPRDVAALSLERLADVVDAGGHALWLDDNRDGRLFLLQGEAPFDEMGMARLIARFEGHDWPRPLVRNHVAGTLLGGDFPGLDNFILVAIADGSRRFGWICSCNLRNGGEFGTVQASVLSSVASILGTHQCNLDLYRQHGDLLLSFVRSLGSSLDAKDPYTRGHSERVALIARRLGAQLKLPAEDLRDIYLSGLLHDIGKIGVNDAVLQKTGKLTSTEFEHIKRHPVIGYNILAGLKNLQAVLPGVRHHHESWSGNGYPDGLRGESIPLMARIIAVADSYDAMSSDRPYRPGMSIGQVEQKFREGAGDQWDPRIVTAYFALRDEISAICTSHPTAGGVLDDAAPTMPALADPGDPLQTIDNLRDALNAVLKP